MAKPSGILSESFASTASISEDVPEKHVNDVLRFLKGVGISDPVPDHCDTKDFYSYLIRGILKPLNIQRGRVTCLVSVKPAFTNFFGGFHGGAIASVAEAVSVATARTVVAEDTELFLGELSISYLSSAPKNAEVIVDGSVVRSGRNLTVIAQEFKLKKTGKLIYTARATFYHMLKNVGGFHGGAIPAVAEAVSIATARTIVAEDKELFLGELSISYLSAAPKNAEVIVDGFVLWSGRNLTVIASEFKLKKTGNVVYTARATFYHMPVAKL